MGGVEGEGFAAAGLAVAGFLNASDFVVNVIKDAASLVGALNQVAGFVVAVATFDEGPGWGLPWRASDGLGRCVFECAGCFQSSKTVQSSLHFFR